MYEKWVKKPDENQVKMQYFNMALQPKQQRNQRRRHGSNASTAAAVAVTLTSCARLFICSFVFLVRHDTNERRQGVFFLFFCN